MKENLERQNDKKYVKKKEGMKAAVPAESYI